ncbi:MAG: hypothetical protein M5U15_13590 [Kiritimatiellae bacterium]|nr:hypothetical protein [Kiritimatiellia bacterium]
MTKPVSTQTPAVLPAEKANSQLVGNLDAEAQKVVNYHLAAERCGTLSVWCAAMAGAEILKKKRELGHGNGFLGWKKSLPFSASSADNYINLAQKLEQRISALPATEMAELLPAVAEAQHKTGNTLALLNLPSPMDVFNPAHERIARVIRHVTNEKTLTQLYFDWEIMAQPKKPGGIRGPQKTEPPIAVQICERLAAACQEFLECRHLMPAEQRDAAERRLLDTLQDSTACNWSPDPGNERSRPRWGV